MRGKKRFVFNPQPDITAYELAQVLAVMQVRADEKAFKLLSKECARHFVEDPTSVESWKGEDV